MSNVKCRILCIDDHKDSAEMLQLLLSHEDYEVSIATSISEALQLATSESFDLYVLDRRLPDGSGIELCRQLQVVTPAVPCIFYSGDAYELHRQQALEAGAEGYVSKPNIEGLIEAVVKLLDGSECATAG
jgi:CheY-like chemotaxis protein